MALSINPAVFQSNPLLLLLFLHLCTIITPYFVLPLHQVTKKSIVLYSLNTSIYLFIKFMLQQGCF